MNRIKDEERKDLPTFPGCDHNPRTIVTFWEVLNVRPTVA